MDELHNFCDQDLGALPSSSQVAVHDVPLVVATAETLAGLGRLVDSFAAAEVSIVAWPVAGWRPLVAGTGNEGGVVQDVFEYERIGQLQYAHNRAVGRRYLIGWYGDPATASDDREPATTARILTHEANYHPDGGQVFFPRGGEPFVALLAPPGDDVRAEDFKAYWFDGSCGVHIDPNVWHQPIFPVSGGGVFDDKQGRVHACVSVDFVAELGGYLAVPLTR